MRIVNFRKAVATALLTGGFAVGGSVALALTHDVGDPSFEEINLGTLDYYYLQGPPNSPFWKDHSKSTGKNAVYTLNQAVNIDPDLPDPLSGNQAIDGEGAYNYQVLTDTFVSGHTYTFTAHIQGWEGNTSDANDRFWMYLFGGVGPTGDDAPGDAGQSGTMDGSSIIRATWHQTGTIDGVFKTGTGQHSFLPFTGFNRSGDSDWTLVGLNYTATAADAGKRIGLGFWANELGAVDDIALTSVALLGDYDENGSVGNEDYELWKNSFGQSAAPGGEADGNRDGIINAADYTVWRNNYSPNLDGAGAVAVFGVPEPCAMTLIGIASGLAAFTVTGRKRN
jgi:hypothetical protein